MTAKTVILFFESLEYRIAVAPQRETRSESLNWKKPTIRIYNLQLREAFWELKLFNVVTIYIMEAIDYAHIKAPGTARIGTQIH